MIKDTKEKLDQIVKTHKCPDHEAALTVAWSKDENSYVIRCGEGHFPEEVTRIKTRTEEFRADELAPVGEGLNLLPQADLGNGEVITLTQLAGLIGYAKRYGLDAYRGHVVLMYGKPYIGLDGYLYHANQSKLPYSLRSRPLTDDERKTYIIPEGAHAWTAEVILPTLQQSFTGMGVVTVEEMTATSDRNKQQLRSPVVARHPWQLAQKRAEWQTLRRGFPIGETEEKREGGIDK